MSEEHAHKKGNKCISIRISTTSKFGTFKSDWTYLNHGM